MLLGMLDDMFFSREKPKAMMRITMINTRMVFLFLNRGDECGTM